MTSPKCSHCAAPLNAATIKDARCPECGKAIPQFAKSTGSPEAARRANRRATILLVAILVLGLPLGFLYGMARDGKLGQVGTVFFWVGVGVNALLALASLINLFLTDSTDSPPDN
jgi:hypothetical protein